MQHTPEIHIDRRPQTDGPAAFELTVSGQGEVRDLAKELAARLQPYTSHIETQQLESGLRLAFVADKAPLGKWELGRINRESLLAWHANLSGT